ncbi:MAG: S41 family peptidase [Acidobacteriota bacterium]
MAIEATRLPCFGVLLVAFGLAAVPPARAAGTSGADPTSEALPGSFRVAASDARQQGDIARAVTLYDALLAADPADREARYNAGILREIRGDAAGAVNIWMQALIDDPANLFAYEHLVHDLAGTPHLDDLVEAETIRLTRRPDDEVRRLRLALALQGAGRLDESVAELETVLLDHPASNIAYTFLKDGFRTREDWLAYVRDVGERAGPASAPTNLKVLHIRLLLERGAVAQAASLAGPVAGESEEAHRLLARAGLLTIDEAAAAIAGSLASDAADPASSSGSSPDTPVTTEKDGASPSVRGVTAEPDTGIVNLAPAPADESLPPDFGPDNPRSVPLHLARSRAALADRAEATAMAELRQVLRASPLALQPRMTLSLLLAGQGRDGEARAILRGAVAISPWDLYQQVWRIVRDEFHDPDFNGVDIYRRRDEARARIRSVADAKNEIAALLAALDDRWARMFAPALFANYLLAPNAAPPATAERAAGPRTARPWITVPEEAYGDDDPERTAPSPADADGHGADEVRAGGSTAGGTAAGGDHAGRSAATGPADANGHSGVRPGSTNNSTETISAAETSVADLAGAGDGGSSPAGDQPAGDPPAHPGETAVPILPVDSTPRAGRAARVATAFAQDPRVRSARYPLATLVPETGADPHASIGYLSIPTLAGPDVARQVERALAQLTPVAGVIVDLRHNRGGDATFAVEVAAQFLPAGSLVTTYLTRRGGQLQLTREAGPFRPTGPLAVLVDGTTASAAELLAAALRDQARAVLVGERTAGKGVGQKAVLLADGSGLSLTRFELRAPAGERWDRAGLTPAVPISGTAETGAVRVAARALARRLRGQP